MIYPHHHCDRCWRRLNGLLAERLIRFEGFHIFLCEECMVLLFLFIDYSIPLCHEDTCIFRTRTYTGGRIRGGPLYEGRGI